MAEREWMYTGWSRYVQPTPQRTDTKVMSSQWWELPRDYKDAWAFLCKYWTSNEYKDKRRAAQASRDNYNARTQLAENSKELDAQALYCMEGGFVHGRVPIADGVVDKETLIAAKSSYCFSTCCRH
ncbi:hypothetical protein E2562_019041 [Oryza meyeriana var. granulata]|uniref:Uncharacterized protein n=1 Tax=Oryza meyeriana var. granulata TaxID=110450 RepID=A0A6G1EMX1_9ORYZ|nr:hypothetical protein E2562_019041 [Oryza meyeriana var. granulata]